MADPFPSLCQQFVCSKRVFVKILFSPGSQVGQAASDCFNLVVGCPSNMRFRSAQNLTICARNFNGGIDFPFLWSCEYHTRRSREVADFRKNGAGRGGCPALSRLAGGTGGV